MKKFKYTEITPEKIYEDRRSFVKSIGYGLGTLSLGILPFSKETIAANNENKITSYEDITTYNNYYEFGTGKSDPYIRSQNFKTNPWNLRIEGEVEKPLELSIEEILTSFPSEERILKLRCVEGWSMVIPWIGYSLKKLLDKVQPLGSAKFLEFTTLADPNQMPGVGGFNQVLNWPYQEGLRIDEAYHPLTLMTFGLYGEKLPEQNGAPIRVIVPWKYGFKSAKSIVRIKFVEKMPLTSWVDSAPNEYGFYSNVNPNVPHRRWSQQTERRIGGGIFSKRHQTLMFNGYSEEVANLYGGMDLKKFF